MRISRCFYLAALLFGLCGLAKADSIDFKMTVLDGPLHGEVIDNSNPFPVVFGECPANSTPALQGASGCFELTNNTGGTITSLDLIFNNSIGGGPNSKKFLNGQTPDCAASAFFDNTGSTCTLNSTGTQYILDFTSFNGGSGIPATGQYSSLYLAIFGPDPIAFGNNKDPGMGEVTYTPEPSSILLLFTGVFLMGGAFMINRKRAFLR